MTRAEALRAAVARLKAAGVEQPALDARILLAEAAGLERAALFLRMEETPSPEESARFAAWIAAREGRQPVAQILGRRWFYGRSFRVTADTLDPRPDSETLIEGALAALGRRGIAAPRILDLGLGTGCLLLTLLAELPEAQGLHLLHLPPLAWTCPSGFAARQGLRRTQKACVPSHADSSAYQSGSLKHRDCYPAFRTQLVGPTLQPPGPAVAPRCLACAPRPAMPDPDRAPTERHASGQDDSEPPPAAIRPQGF